MNKLSKADKQKLAKSKQAFEELHKELYTGKRIEYTYSPGHEEDRIKIYTFGDGCTSLNVNPEGTWSLE